MGSGRMSILFLGLLVLVMYCSPGDALKCLQCEISMKSCTKNATCRADQDACLQAYAGGSYYYSCWKYADCNIQSIGEVFTLPNIHYHCCQRDIVQSRRDGGHRQLNSHDRWAVGSDCRELPFLIKWKGKEP
ncbi:CD59 glycoprotein-like [Macrotis lagotis]|uniref:CD59 glycoprotein-like n=1 Tax=Macrotis lagotis TaxID=92651 RepID=UPI003D68A140